MKVSSLTFVIPTHNNQKTIASVLSEVASAGKRVSHFFNIVVCDDGSTDGTAQILKEIQKKMPNLDVMTHGKNTGYGQTIKELYSLAKGEWLFSVPGDFQIDPKEVEKLIPYVDRADMILGRRVSRQDPPGRLFQSYIYNRLLGLLFGIAITDVNTVRLMKTSILNNIHLGSSSAFVDAELVIEGIRKGFRIIEIPIDHKNDQSKGSGGHIGTIMPTIFEMIRYRLSL